MLRPVVNRLFDGFGGSVLFAQGRRPTVGIDLPGDLRSARRLIRRHCPAAPGVYGMIAPDGQLIYVGKSKALRRRLVSYFSPSAKGEKAGRIVDHTRRLMWEKSPDEFAALLRELELIRRWQPRFNVQGRAGRQRPFFVCIGRGPAPYVFLAPGPTSRVGDLFGPLRGSRRWRDAVRRVNDCFGLRNCRDGVSIRFADQAPLFTDRSPPRCVRYEIGFCPAPCAAACSAEQYHARVRAARDFLAGRDVSMLARVEAEMRAAAANAEFERAAALRDTWQELGRLHRQLSHLRTVRGEYTFVYPLAGSGGRTTWYVIDRGHVAGAEPAPRDAPSAARCLRLLDEVYLWRGQDGAPSGREDLDIVLLVSLWFRKHPDQLQRTLTPEEARRICRSRSQRPLC